MPQDAFTLNSITKEINCLISGAKINKIYMPNFNECYFVVYSKGNFQFKISVSPDCPCISLVKETPISLLTAPPFLMLLRKHLLGATLKSAELINFDRIIKLDFLTHKEFKEQEVFSLYVEIMGRYSNCILVKGNKILGKMRGTEDITFSRNLLTGIDYVLPKSQGKFNPILDQMEIPLNSYNGDLSQFLLDRVCGFSSKTAIWVANLIEKQENRCKLLKEIINGKYYNPCVLIENKVVKDFFVYPYNQGEYLYFDSLLKAQQYYLENKNTNQQLNGIKQSLKSVLNAKIKKINKRIQAINGDLSQAENLEENKLKGELLLANIYKIKHRQKSISLENYYSNNEMVEISLDENKSPVDNANFYYKKYSKQKRTIDALVPQKQQAQELLNYLNSLLESVDLALTENDLISVKLEMQEGNLLEKPKEKNNAKKQANCEFRVYQLNGAVLRVGKNNISNDKLVSSSQKNSLWFHVKDYHSSHAVLEGERSQENLIICAEICAYFSKARDGGKTDVVYTEIKNVKKPQGAKPGFVIYNNFKSLTVEAKNHQELLKSN